MGCKLSTMSCSLSCHSTEKFFHAVQFEVINKDDQQALPAPLPLLHQVGDRERPPRPAPVRLSTQPYSASRYIRRQGDHAVRSGTITGGYQNLALLPVSEPNGMDAGHLSDAFPGNGSLQVVLGFGPQQWASMHRLASFMMSILGDNSVKTAICLLDLNAAQTASYPCKPSFNWHCALHCCRC
jgi:hypothetical protein